MKIKRIPLKEIVDISQVIAISSDVDWYWWNKIERTKDRPFETIFLKPDKQTKISYIEDDTIDIKYIAASGEEADQVIREAAEFLDVYTRVEIEATFATGDLDDGVHAVYLAGIDAGLEYNEDYIPFFEMALSDPREEIRGAVVLAIGYMGWPHWKPKLREMVASDPVEVNRYRASLMLESFEKENIQDPPG
jgi:hypothetical protein